MSEINVIFHRVCFSVPQHLSHHLGTDTLQILCAPDDFHWWCIYYIICKINIWCTVLQLFQSGGTDFMSAIILDKPLLKTLACLVGEWGIVMFVFRPPSFWTHISCSVQCSDTRSMRRKEKKSHKPQINLKFSKISESWVKEHWQKLRVLTPHFKRGSPPKGHFLHRPLNSRLLHRSENYKIINHSLTPQEAK